MAAITAGDIIRLLNLKPLPIEGGYYAETYRAGVSTPTVSGSRHLSTAIYYLLTPETFSALHRLPGDEVYHHYLGDPVELLFLESNERGAMHVLGSDLAAGMRPQVVAPGGTWQGSELRSGGSFALLGTTMSPGYHIDDFELGDGEALAAAYPAFTDAIRRLTR